MPAREALQSRARSRRAPDVSDAPPGQCLDADGRAAAQQMSIEEVSSLLGVAAGDASLLVRCFARLLSVVLTSIAQLRAFRWNQDDVLSRYFEDADAACAAAGVAPPRSVDKAKASAAPTAPCVSALCRAR